MSKTRLRKVVKSVRGKKGSVRRTYWVKSVAPTHIKLKRADAGVKLGHATSYLGSQLGSMAGARYGAHLGAKQGYGLYGQIGASFVGSSFGAGFGRHAGALVGYNAARATKMRESTERNLANIARLAGHGVRAYNLFKTVQAVGHVIRR